MSKLRLLLYHFKRLDWIFIHPFISSKHVKIEKPIFILGNQGGGNTFLSRILRRNTDVVSVGGNNDNWTSADEMQKVFEFKLPFQYKLSSKYFNTDPVHDLYSVPRSWSYGTNDLFQKYHHTEKDLIKTDAKKFRLVIKKCLKRCANGRSARFIDKSQVYTLKSRLIQETLKDSDPYFIFMTRDPIISCYRAAQGKAGDMARYKHLTMDEKIIACAEHWNNCMRVALDDSKYIENFFQLKFEDLITDPKREVKKVCEFLNLAFDEDMMPQQHHVIPFATRYLDRWWPLRKSVNKKYDVPHKYAKVIADICEHTAIKLDYKINLKDYQ
jgi:hypothetical protein